MSRPDKSAEPSMEDILASIRKIIAEEPGKAAFPMAPAPVVEAAAKPAAPTSAPTTAQAASPEKSAGMVGPADVDDVLSLATDDVPTQRPTRPTPAPASPPQSAAAQAPAPKAPAPTSGPAADVPAWLFPRAPDGQRPADAATPAPAAPAPKPAAPQPAAQPALNLRAVVPGRTDAGARASQALAGPAKPAADAAPLPSGPMPDVQPRAAAPAPKAPAPAERPGLLDRLNSTPARAETAPAPTPASTTSAPQPIVAAAPKPDAAPRADLPAKSPEAAKPAQPVAPAPAEAKPAQPATPAPAPAEAKSAALNGPIKAGGPAPAGEKLAPNGRTFTLLHEFVHVLLRQSSLCDIEDGFIRPPQEQKTEIFCNAVAAAALVPTDALLSDPLVSPHKDARDWSDDELGAIARNFGVSTHVILRRLLTAGRTTRAFYAKRAALWSVYEPAPPKADDDEFKRNMPQEVVSDLGRPFVSLVLESYLNSNLSLSDTSRYLGLRAGQVAKVRELVLGS